MPLPPCHSRREIEGETNVFYCAHPLLSIQDQQVTVEVCTVCPYWRLPSPETFRPFPPPPPRGECRCLGEQTGLRDCPTCTGHVRVKVFACGHPAHGETTLAECLGCPDHEEREPATRKPAADEEASGHVREARTRATSLTTATTDN